MPANEEVARFIQTFIIPEAEIQLAELRFRLHRQVSTKEIFSAKLTYSAIVKLRAEMEIMYADAGLTKDPWS